MYIYEHSSCLVAALTSYNSSHMGAMAMAIISVALAQGIKAWLDTLRRSIRSTELSM
jgi:hypothetical protein